MTYDAWQTLAASDQSMEAFPPALQALAADERGNWEEAHRLSQLDPGKDGAWVHAYLHRKEGDATNAAYWYAQAGQAVCGESLETEWRSVITALLEKFKDQP